MSKPRFIVIPMLIILSQTVFAAESRGGAADQVLHKAKIMMRQIAQERDAALARNKKLEAEIEDLKSEIRRKDQRLAKTKSRLGKVADQGMQLSERLEESYDKMRELAQRHRELEAKYQNTVAQKENLNAEYKHCINMNLKLYQAGTEVLELYKKEASEDINPVLQLEAVEIENAVQDYRFKMDDLTLQRNSDVSAASN